jgi:hypothetical protein
VFEGAWESVRESVGVCEGARENMSVRVLCVRIFESL